MSFSSPCWLRHSHPHLLVLSPRSAVVIDRSAGSIHGARAAAQASPWRAHGPVASIRRRELHQEAGHCSTRAGNRRCAVDGRQSKLRAAGPAHGVRTSSVAARSIPVPGTRQSTSSQTRRSPISSRSPRKKWSAAVGAPAGIPDRGRSGRSHQTDAVVTFQKRTDIVTPRVVAPKTGETLMLAFDVEDPPAMSRFT